MDAAIQIGSAGFQYQHTAEGRAILFHSIDVSEREGKAAVQVEVTRELSQRDSYMQFMLHLT